MQRITLRDRSYERNMEWDYIDQLNQAYEEFFDDIPLERIHRGVPVLKIDTNNLDFVHIPENLKRVENSIRQALKMSPFQPELPFDLAEEM